LDGSRRFGATPAPNAHDDHCESAGPHAALNSSTRLYPSFKVLEVRKGEREEELRSFRQTIVMPRTALSYAEVRERAHRSGAELLKERPIFLAQRGLVEGVVIGLDVVFKRVTHASHDRRSAESVKSRVEERSPSSQQAPASAAGVTASN
jgi:hypothetical protein